MDSWPRELFLCLSDPSVMDRFSMAITAGHYTSCTVELYQKDKENHDEHVRLVELGNDMAEKSGWYKRADLKIPSKMIPICQMPIDRRINKATGEK